MVTHEEQIGVLLRQFYLKSGKLLLIATVESATGGKIADKITSIPGSSAYFKGSVIAYSNEVKTTVVGVKRETIESHGAVSSETAVEMARGGMKLLNTDICIADTGIAGPGGSTPDKPVGLFYIGLAHKDGVQSHKYVFQGDREQNKQQAVVAALGMLTDYLHSLINS
jgi:nicotinamide-nucleotide amidase